MPLAFSYVRFSAERQSRGASLDRQVDAAKRYADLHGLTLDTSSYSDLGVSAFKSKNLIEGSLGTFLAAVDNKKVPKGSFLLVESLDRLSRDNVDVALELFLSITRKGITIVTLMDQQVYSQQSIRENWTKLIIALAVMARANEESVTKSVRVKQAWDRKIQRGELATTKLPSWLILNADKKGFTIHKERAVLINRLFDLAIKGYGGRQIAAILIKEKVPVMQWAKEWNQNLVGSLLSSPATYGHKDGKDDYFPAIITKKKFMTAADAIKGRKWKGGTSDSVPNLFAGLGFCAFCGSRVRYIPSTTGYPYIRCLKANDTHTCRGKLFPYKACELAFIYTMTRKAELNISGEFIVEQASQAPALRGEIDSLKQRQKQLLHLASLVEGVDAVAVELQGLQKQIMGLEDALAQLDRNPISRKEIEVHRDLFDRYHNLTNDAERVDLRRQMKVAMARLFKRIEFGVDKDGWKPILFITLIDGVRALVEVTPFLSSQSQKRQKRG